MTMMMKGTRKSLARCLLASALCVTGFAELSAAESGERPNVLFILADDFGWRDLSGEGSAFYETPHLDRIASEGARFTQGYATCQVCSPSRASIMTGKYPARLGITTWIGDKAGTDWKRNTPMLPALYQLSLSADDETIAEAFKAAGYRTFFAGKWHLGDDETAFPDRNGFDINKGGYGSGSPRGGYFSPYKNPNLENGPPGENLTLRLADETVRFIEDSADEPFFAFLSFYAVHGPVQSTRELWQKYRDKAESSGDMEPRFLVDRTSPVRQTQNHPVYGGLVESMDTAIGRVVATLERLGLAENTIVVFTSDNGGVSAGDDKATSNLPLRGGKGRQWEGGIRVPFYVKWPEGLRSGLEIDYPVTGTDFYPTLLELAGLPLKPEQHVDGRSLVPLLEGDELEARPLYWHYPHYGNQGGDPSSIIRLGKWKLIRYHDGRPDEFYNLQTDPEETTDLANRYPMGARALAALLDDWLVEMEAQYPFPNPDFDAAAYEQWKRDMEAVERPKLEAAARAMLQADWEPNETWWGSELAE